jgi:pimeloyl-ACP methyl ester carboxylesterase
MTLPTLVLVHGALHARDCWDLTIAELSRQAPDLRVLALNLPGRRGKKGNLLTATIDEWVESILEDVALAGLDDIVIVGHSMAGLTVPSAVARLGAARVREMILIAAFVPPQGFSLVDTLRGPFAGFVRHAVKRPVPMTVPTTVASLAFCNGMTAEQRRFTLSRLCPESPTVMDEAVCRPDLPDSVGRTWLLATRDRSVSPRQQRSGIAALGGVGTIIPINSCHDVMVREPVVLADILRRRCEDSRHPNG